MQQVAEEERDKLGLRPFQPLDPHLLAKEYGIPVYSLNDLAAAAPDAVRHFAIDASRRWSAALIPIGPSRIIIENDTHLEVRRRSSIGHELGHHLLEHPFASMVLTDERCRRFDPNHEKAATFLAGHLLIPDAAVKRAVFDQWTNARVAEHFQVSVQFAQMRTHGWRIRAARALQKQAASRR